MYRIKSNQIDETDYCIDRQDQKQPKKIRFVQSKNPEPCVCCGKDCKFDTFTRRNSYFCGWKCSRGYFTEDYRKSDERQAWHKKLIENANSTCVCCKNYPRFKDNIEWAFCGRTCEEIHAKNNNKPLQSWSFERRRKWHRNIICIKAITCIWCEECPRKKDRAFCNANCEAECHAQISKCQ